MKVAILIHNLAAGGAERVTLSLGADLASRGHEVLILTQDDATKDGYPFPPDLRRAVVGVEEATGRLSANLRRVSNLRQALRAERPDVIVCMMTTSVLYGVLAAVGLATKVIGAERVYPPTMPIGRGRTILRRWLYPMADVIVAQTSEMADWFHDNVPRARVQVIPNAVQLPLPAAPPELMPDAVVPREVSVVLAAGRLTEQKGFDRLLHAFAGLTFDAEVRLVIAGEGPEHAHLEQLAGELGLDDTVHLVGRVGNLADWYRRAAVFVLSSRFEGFPNVLVEAMAHGVASIAFDCPTGPRDILTDGRDGLLVPDGDVDLLTHALDRLLADPALRERLGRQACGIARRFAAAAVTDQWETLIAETVAT